MSKKSIIVAGPNGGPAGMGRKPMKPNDITEANDPDLRTPGAALLRAAELARQTAISTETNLIVMKDGKLTRIPAQSRRETVTHGAKKFA